MHAIRRKGIIHQDHNDCAAETQGGHCQLPDVEVMPDAFHGHEGQGVLTVASSILDLCFGEPPLPSTPDLEEGARCGPAID